MRNFVSTISKILDGFRRKKKTVGIFSDIKKTYDQINRDETFKQLENLRMIEFIRELISDRWKKVKVGGSISQNKKGSTKCDISW